MYVFQILEIIILPDPWDERKACNVGVEYHKNVGEVSPEVAASHRIVIQ